ncbi:MAG: tripartite tricarboxylate transporter substrate binding protein [Betaproteobacteria bacterium]|nr:tripartite tricarboxylate transporter substrate binding protein [Betaproteobacteria bacterium]
MRRPDPIGSTPEELGQFIRRKVDNVGESGQAHGCAHRLMLATPQVAQVDKSIVNARDETVALEAAFGRSCRSPCGREQQFYGQKRCSKPRNRTYFDTLFNRALLFCVTATLVSAAAIAQTYPQRPVRILSSLSGSTNDYFARIIAQELTTSLGRQVIVDNRVGSLSIEIVARAAPDGHTLLSYGTPLWMLPLLRGHVTWNFARDFAPISWTTSSPNILVVHASVPVRSVTELMALAQSKPGEINYASSLAGSAAHLAGELFRAMARVNIVRIPYKGMGPALNALIANEVHMMFAGAPIVAPHVKAGRIRSLAITSAQRSPLAPDLPTVAASGLPGYESSLILGIFAPAKTDSTIINRLNQEIVKLLGRPDIRERVFRTGTEVVASSPEKFSAKIRSEIEIWEKVIRETGIREEK